MKKLIVFLYVVFGALLVATGCFAQDRVIKGRVHTFDSIPLINASIKVKSTKQVVKSDTLGNFYAACNDNDVIKVYAKGFYPEKVKLTPNIKLVIANLRLKPGEKNREIAIGYGHILNADKLNAVANLNSDDMDFSQYSNLYEVIRGRFSGVQIEGEDIIIRGKNSLYGSSAALIVVDGVPVDASILRTLPPVQVKSINIIKDGSSAIYGSRGANGVVLIDTKKGGDY